jgi:hypothetical protein
MRCWPGRCGLRVLIAPLLLAAGLGGLGPAAASAAAARRSSTAIRRVVFAGLLAAFAAAVIGIAVMSGSGAGSVTPHAQIVSQGTVVTSGPHPSGPTG